MENINVACIIGYTDKDNKLLVYPIRSQVSKESIVAFCRRPEAVININYTGFGRPLAVVIGSAGLYDLICSLIVCSLADIGLVADLYSVVYYAVTVSLHVYGRIGIIRYQAIAAVYRQSSIGGYALIHHDADFAHGLVAGLVLCGNGNGINTVVGKGQCHGVHGTGACAFKRSLIC